MLGRHIQLIKILFLSLILCGCQSVKIKDHAPNVYVDVSTIQNAKPKVEKRSFNGNPESYRVNGHTYHVLKSAKGYKAIGVASWYGVKFSNHLTSSGEPYDMFAMTAANKALPIPTYVKVTNLENRRQVIVKINDRGPFIKRRLIDLSYVAALKLGLFPRGTARVQVEAIDPYEFNHKYVYHQLGAFKYKNHAKQLQKKIREKKIPCKIFKRKIKNMILYEVKVGPAKSQRILDQYLKKIEKEPKKQSEKLLKSRTNRL